MLLTANLEDRDIDLKSWSIWDADGGGSVPYIYDLRKPNWGSGRFEDYNPSLRTNYNKQVQAWGAGLQHVAYLGDRWTTRIGVGFNNIDQSYEHLGTDRGGATPEQDASDSGVSYNVGVTFRPAESMALFLNASRGRTAYSILGSISGDDDRPDSESESYDVGIRMKLLNDQLLGSLVVFRTARANLRYNNPDYNDNPDDPEYNVSVRQYYYDGEERSEGVELDLNAQLSAAWYLHVNATYQEARDRMDPYTSSYGEPMKGTPVVSAGTWLTYTTDHWLPGTLKASFGGNYVDGRSAGSTSFGLPDGYVPSYSVWNGALTWEMKRWRAQLNLDNLSDKTYYSRALFLGGIPGAQRNVRLTLNYSL
ncbi:MAG: TonB-dependent receptor domain-containing protein [Parahaliea sp.]